MTAAKITASYLHAWCLKKFPGDKPHEGTNIASTMANGSMFDVFDHKGHGSHKYIPADKLTADLGEPERAGVFGYWRMHDGSYILRTSRGPLATWSGNPDDKAEWGEYAFDKEETPV